MKPSGSKKILNLPLFLLRNLGLIASSSIMVAAIIFLIGFWQTGNLIIDRITAFFSLTPATPQITVPTLIINQIKAVSELTTAVFVMEAVVPTSQDRKMGDLTIATTKLLYIAYGEVKAGVNLADLTTKDLQIEGKKLKIQLPPPQILDSKIDINRSYVYDYNRGFLGLGPDVAPQLQSLAQQETLAKIIHAACSQGILTQAENKAELAVTQLLTIAGYTQIEVTTKVGISKGCQ